MREYTYNSFDFKPLIQTTLHPHEFRTYTRSRTIISVHPAPLLPLCMEVDARILYASIEHNARHALGQALLPKHDRATSPIHVAGHQPAPTKTSSTNSSGVCVLVTVIWLFATLVISNNKAEKPIFNLFISFSINLTSRLLLRGKCCTKLYFFLWS